jgi:predicted transcriptional regulator
MVPDMDIVKALRLADRPLDDDQLAAVLGVDRRDVHRQCRRLAFQGIIIREQGPAGNIVNKLDRGASAGDGRLYFEDRLSISR